MKEIELTADQARAITKPKFDEMVDNIIARANKSIKEAAEKGMYSADVEITIDFMREQSIYEVMKNRLETKGYTVKLGNVLGQVYGLCLEITWNPENIKE